MRAWSFNHNQAVYEHCATARILIRVDYVGEGPRTVYAHRRTDPIQTGDVLGQWWAGTAQAQHIMAVCALHDLVYSSSQSLYYGMTEEEWETIWSSMPA